MLAFIGAGAGERRTTLDRLANVIGGSAEGDEGLADLDCIHQALTGLGFGEDSALFDPSVVRGLEYYTGAVFEADLLLETRDEHRQAAPLRLDRRRRAL